MCDRIAVLKNGQIVEMDDASRIFDHPEESYTQLLIELMPHMNQGTQLAS